MIESLRNVFKVKELRERVIFTLGILVIYRIGGHIPTPGGTPDKWMLRRLVEKPGGPFHSACTGLSFDNRPVIPYCNSFNPVEWHLIIDVAWRTDSGKRDR